MRRRIALLALSVFYAAIFSAACSRQAPPQIGSSTLCIVTSYKIESLNPVDPQAYFFTEFGAAELPLVLDENYSIKPWVLESLAQVDNLNWRLTLRPNVAFQNGKPLDAAALAACMNRQLARSPSAKSLLPGAQAKVTGEREVVLTTSQPDPTVPAALAEEGIFPIYDVAAVEAVGDDYGKLAESGCYTGPYRIVSLDDRELRLARFADYWQGVPPLEGVSVRFVRDAQARILAVQNMEADIALYPPTEAKRMLAGRDDAFFVTGENSSGAPRVLLNLRSAPFNDTAVRRAFGLGINYEELAKYVSDGVFDTATGFYPPIFPWAIQNQRTDTEEAKRLLDEAGWKIEADGVRVHSGTPLEVTFLIYPQQPDFAKLVTAMQAQLKDVGFRVLVRQVDDINAAMSGSDPAWNAGIISPGIITTGGAPDPLLREYLMTNATRNYGGIADAELDALIEELGRTFDETQRRKLLARIQQLVIAEKAYEVRPVFVRSRVVVGRRYRNYKPSPQLHHVTYATRSND